MTTQAPRGAGPSQLTVFAPAKINLYLNVLGRRPDGYHEIQTVMLPLDFGDDVTLYQRKVGISLECDNSDLPTDDTNLAVRAAKALAAATGSGRGVKIRLKKRIPLAAGLGGGSSDAAAVLSGLNRLWQANLPNNSLHELAAGLGSDVNFFLIGGAAVATGRGERVQPVPCALTANVLLVNPGFGVASSWAYTRWSELHERLTASAPDISVLLDALGRNDLEKVGGCLFNALEAVVLRKYPILGLLKDALKAHGACGALMSGSGATVFGLFSNADQATSAAARIRAEFGPSVWTQLCHCMSGKARE